MIKEYENNYAKYFEDQMTKFESFEFDLYFQQIADTIKYIFKDEDRSRSILDFCCGDGTSTSFLEQMGFDDVIGFDGNSRKVEKAKEKCGAVFFKMDAMDIGFAMDEYRFDIIYASHCFEHFLHPLTILSHTKHLLTKDGKIILVLPYPNSDSEGHPGSNNLSLNEGLPEIKSLYERMEFNVTRMEQMNIREPELLIELKLNK